MRVYNTPNIIPAATVLNTTVNSTPMQLYEMYGFSIQVVFTGTPTGTFKLQASDDPVYASNIPAGARVVTNWTDIDGSDQVVTAAGSVMWSATDAMYNFVRVVYTDASAGASTAVIASCTFNGKGV
jgi:hypothetical protein